MGFIEKEEKQLRRCLTIREAFSPGDRSLCYNLLMKSAHEGIPVLERQQIFDEIYRSWAAETYNLQTKDESFYGRLKWHIFRLLAEKGIPEEGLERNQIWHSPEATTFEILASDGSIYYIRCAPIAAETGVLLKFSLDAERDRRLKRDEKEFYVPVPEAVQTIFPCELLIEPTKECLRSILELKEATDSERAREKQAQLQREATVRGWFKDVPLLPDCRGREITLTRQEVDALDPVLAWDLFLAFRPDAVEVMVSLIEEEGEQKIEVIYYGQGEFGRGVLDIYSKVLLPIENA